MSIAVNMTRKKIGETRANSTSAWLRCPLAPVFTDVRRPRAHALTRFITNPTSSSRSTRLYLLNAAGWPGLAGPAAANLHGFTELAAHTLHNVRGNRAAGR